jgi:PAS domain S-box-containing protein
MRRGRSKPNGIAMLRKGAEKLASKRVKGTPAETDSRDADTLIHELQVHQIELEMQNEELLRAQAEIEESRTKYVDLYDCAPVGYLTFDEEGLILELNLPAAQFLGMERRSLISKPFSLFLQSDSQETFYFHRRGVLRRSTKQTCDLVLKRKDKALIDIQMESIAVTAKGSPAIRSILTDITERERAKSVLRASEERYRSYVDVTGAVGWTTNPNGEVVEDLPSWRRFTGQSEEEIRGTGWTTALHPEDVEHTLNAWNKAVLNKTAYEVEYRMRKYDGAYRLFLARGAPVFGRDGSVREWVGTCIDITDRKAAEEALRESEDRLGLALVSSHMGIWEWDRDANEVFQSPESHKILGSKEASRSLKSFSNLLHPDDRHHAVAAISRMPVDHPEFGTDFRIIRPDGSVRWVAIAGRGYFDDKGVMLRVLGTIQDVTDRKEAEHRQYLLNEIMNVLNDPPALTDPLSLIVAAIQRGMGFDAVGIRLRSGEDYPYFVQNGFSHDFLLAEDSLTVHAQDGGLCRDENGNYSLECTCGLVISGKVEPQNPLFTPRGSCWTNNSFPLLDLPPSRDPRLHPRNRCIHEGYASVALIPIRANREIVGLLQLNDRKKDRFTLDIIHFFEGIGASIGVALMRKDAESQIKKAHEVLEQRVEERTSELREANEEVRLQTEGRKQTEAALYQAQKMEAIGTLAGGIAHDFNNILAAIIGFAEMMEEDAAPSSSEQRRAERIRKAGFRGRDLVKQILTFSRQTSHEKEPVELTELIEEGLKLLRPTLPSTIAITTRILAKESVTLADSVQIHQILMNLCTNAAHAMGEKGGLLEISLEAANFSPGDSVPDPYMTATDYLKLSVRDTGCGMEEETLKRIFDPFFTTKLPGEGTGLGLSVVHGIVKDHHGCVVVDSRRGKGSTFHVYLPKLEASVVAKIKDATASPRGSERILFVDDEQMMIDLNKERLRSLGYKVAVFVSSKKALDVFRKRSDRFDLVITDYTMPDLTGIELAEELFKIRPEIPVILYSGAKDLSLPGRAKKAGIREFLEKPLTKMELAQAIRRALDAKPKG